MLEGLVGGEGFAIDASVIKADANRERFVPAAEAKKLAEGHGASRAVREYLDALEADNPAGPKSESDGPPSGDSTPPKNISPTAPGARWTAVRGGPPFYAYSTTT
jgi:hypothetical protein